MRVRLFLLALCFFCLPAFSQTPKEVLVQELGGCAERRGSGALENDPRPYQPCQNPPVNTLLIREFANGLYGFYADYSQFATTQSNCTVMGLGRLKGTAIVGAVLQFDQKTPEEVCKIAVDWKAKNKNEFSSFQFREISTCQGMCGMNNNVGSISFGGNAIDAFTPSFDCSKASLPSEQTICLDWKLSRLDFRLAELWLSASDDPKEKPKQISWVRSRNACGYDANCLFASYKARIEDMCTSAGLRLSDRGDC